MFCKKHIRACWVRVDRNPIRARVFTVSIAALGQQLVACPPAEFAAAFLAIIFF
jgi:hypothetical protein